MHEFTSEYRYKFVNLYKHLSGGYLCVAYFEPNKFLFGLIMGRIVILDTDKNEISIFSFLMPVGDKEVELADISVDCQGFVFAGDSKGKAISMFDSDGVCIKRVEVNIEPNYLFAYTNKEKEVELLVSSKTAVEMFSIERRSHYPYRASMAAAGCLIDGKTAEGNSLHSGGVAVRSDRLFVVNKLQDDKSLQVLQHDDVGGDDEHMFIVTGDEKDEGDEGDEAATVTSRGIKGIAFAEEDNVAVYLDDTVYIFRMTAKESLS